MEKIFRIALALRNEMIRATPGFFLGAHSYAHQRPDWKVLSVRRTTMLTWEQALDLQPDGILGVIGRRDDVSPEQAGGARVIILNTHPSLFPSVVPDGNQAGQLAARYLLSRRLRHFAYVRYGLYYFSEQRRNAFISELRAGGYHGPVADHIYEEHEDPMPGFRDWLPTLPKPCGVLCAHDQVGRDVIIASQECNIAVPDDLAVLGISNDRLVCSESPVTLSSVEQHYEKVGYRAAAVLDEMLRGGPAPPGPVLIPPGEVVTRESTRVFGVEDPLVRRALLVINEEHTEPLTMPRLLARLGNVSQRTVTMRFHQALGRSPYQEILHSRVEKARKLLRGTRLTLEEIAFQSGFYDTAQFSRHFRKINGDTPAQYRRVNQKDLNA